MKSYLKVYQRFAYIALIIIALNIFNLNVFATDSTPKTLKNFKSLHDNTYSQKVRENKYDLDDTKTVEKFLNDAAEQCDISIAVSFYAVNSIIEQDRFRSIVDQFWDGCFKDAEYNEKDLDRKHATSEFFHADLSSLAPEDYEKYGFLSCRDKKQDLIDQTSIYKNRGQIIVNFKKENLLDRTTMVVGDSLNHRNYLGIGSVTPTPVSQPRAVCIPGYSNNTIKELSRAITNKDLLPTRPGMISKLNKFEKNFEYLELQLHGDLTFSKDVESIDVIGTSFNKTSAYKKFKEIKELIKSKGYDIPCNFIDCSDIELHDDYTRPGLNQTVKTSDGKIMISAPEGLFLEGSKLFSKYLEENSDDYKKVFSEFDKDKQDITEKIKIFDIFVLDPAGNKVTKFDDYVTLYIQIPDDYDEYDLEAVHINEGPDQDFDEWIEEIDGVKYLAFKTDHFSPYAIVDTASNNNAPMLIFIITSTIVILGSILLSWIIKEKFFR